MRVVCEILDDALRELYPELLASKNFVSTSRGETSELLGVLIEIERPRARLSRSEIRGKPFTCLGELLWYLSRDNRLRSNDAYIGLPHDVFCFTMLQEIVARSLRYGLGTYKHFVGSMHLYAAHREDAERYLDEAVQPRVEMPPMSEGDPWPSIRRVLEAERCIRNGEAVEAENWDVDPYWADLIRLLQIFAASGDEERIGALKSAMAWKRYIPYIDSRRAMKLRPPYKPAQPSLRL